MSERTSVNDQVTLRAALPERLVLNEEWLMRVKLHNASRERVILSLRRDVRSDVLVEVRNAAGQRLERTEFGKRHLPGMSVPGVDGFVIDDVTSAQLKHLEPGDSYTWQIEFGKCFDFAPGEYTVEISVPVEPLGRMRHEVPINVWPAAK